MLIDSNILIYAINVSSPKHITAQHFLQTNREHLVIAHQNIFETLRVLTHKKFSHPMPSKQALDALEPIMNVCTIIAPDYKTHRIAFELIAKYNVVSNEVFDAYLVATALSWGISEIATDNEKAIRKYKEITVVNPFM